nr:caffeoyl-CoA O-methyltransferase-like [Tanacetum cinerariifolium]
MATVNASSDNQPAKHQEVGHKSLLQSDALYQYILETSVYPREPAPMKELREVTAKHPWNLMTTSADEGQFLNMLLKLINAKNTMEIGVYTGYSLLSTALALPEDGKILALDINRENYEIGLPIIEKAGVAHKIDFREGPALPLLDQMIKDEKFHGSFDFIFVDADKDNYLNYHKRLIDLVKVGGVIGYDNTLWNGSLVAPPDAPLRKYVRYYRDFVLELNKALAVDPRVEICQLPVGDGITLLASGTTQMTLQIGSLRTDSYAYVSRVCYTRNRESSLYRVECNLDSRMCVHNKLLNGEDLHSNISASSLEIMDIVKTHLRQQRTRREHMMTCVEVAVLLLKSVKNEKNWQHLLGKELRLFVPMVQGKDGVVALVPVDTTPESDMIMNMHFGNRLAYRRKSLQVRATCDVGDAEAAY